MGSFFCSNFHKKLFLNIFLSKIFLLHLEMKNFAVLSLLILFFTLSCNKEKRTAETLPETPKKELPAVEKFTVDSIKVEDSLKIDKNLTVEFKSKLLFFPQIKDKALLDSIYTLEKIKADDYTKANITKQLELKKSNFFDETKESLKDWKPDVKQIWDSNSQMNVFSNENDLLTIKYSGDGFTGGAHGYYYEFYRIFDLKNNKTLQLSDVISDRDSKLWNRILMDNFLKNDLKNGQAEMLLVKEIPLNSNFYFDKDHIYFLYNQYEITAYAAGPVLIKIPFSAIKPLLKTEFKSRLGL